MHQVRMLLALWEATEPSRLGSGGRDPRLGSGERDGGTSGGWVDVTDELGRTPLYEACDGCVCVCVCVYIYICVCVCVLGGRVQATIQV